MKTIIERILISLFVIIILSACAPEVGSDAWCVDLKEKPKGDWTVNEATEYTKNCMF